MGCEVNILRMTEYIKQQFEMKLHKNLWALFIDLKSAFDTVNHRLLFEKMEGAGVKEEIIESVK